MLIKSVKILIIFGLTLANSQEQGKSCIAERTNTPGICKLIRNCPSVINDYRENLSHTRCGFEGKKEIVCCPNKSTTTPTPSLENHSGNGRIHEAKCKEYTKAIYEYVKTISLAANSEPTYIPINKCGTKQIPLIVGGTLAEPREFPHMALLGFEKNKNEISWACGGTLISDRYVLTAAHCLYSRELGEPKKIRLGELEINSKSVDSQPEDFNIVQLIPHPDWRLSSSYNDIALIKLDRVVQLNPYKRPACLPIVFENPEKHNIATGWGRTEWGDHNNSLSLQKVKLEKFTNAECNQVYETQRRRRLKDGIREATQLCSGSRTESKDTCQGDSGGPLQVFHHKEYCMYTVIGITSFGILCGNIGVPGVYTRVFPYIDWIEGIVWSS